MASESQPPPQSGGNAKYAIIGVLLLLAAVGIYFVTRPSAPTGETTETRPTGPVDAGTAAPVAENTDIELPVELPDLGPPEPDMGARRRVVKVVYVDAPGGNWDCSGNVNASAARAVFAEAQPQMRSCYERRLKINNTLQGSAVVQVRVSRTGAVDAVRVNGSLHDNDTFTCMRGIANGLRFPPPGEGTCAVLQQPFSFTPRN